jgi:hypothetical protein
MPFKLIPALRKCDVAPFVLDAILDVLLTTILVRFLTSILDPILRCSGDAICLYMGVFWIWVVGRDLFLAYFWTLF